MPAASSCRRFGILGVDKKGVSITNHRWRRAGGEGCRRIGPSFAESEVPAAVEAIVDSYMASRREGETFAGFVRRADISVLRKAVYDGKSG